MEIINPLYSDVLDAWLTEHRMRIMESTAYNYERALIPIKKYFDGVRVKEISAGMIFEYVTELKREISLTSTRIYCKVMQMSLNYAIKYGYIYYNPTNDVTLPKRARTEIKPFEESEIPLLLAAEGPEWVKDGIVIAYRTGMRPGEIYGLKWSDIYFEQHFISVQRAISRANSTSLLKETKTEAGVRRIDIDSKLIEHLHRMRKCTDSNFVFPGTQHEYKVPWNLSKHLKRMCEDVGIEPRNFYSLRHTHATILLAHGVHPKIVQERLGHSDIKITMEIYSHVSPTLQQKAVNIFEEI